MAATISSARQAILDRIVDRTTASSDMADLADAFFTLGRAQAELPVVVAEHTEVAAAK